MYIKKNCFLNDDDVAKITIKNLEKIDKLIKENFIFFNIKI